MHTTTDGEQAILDLEELSQRWTKLIELERAVATARSSEEEARSVYAQARRQRREAELKVQQYLDDQVKPLPLFDQARKDYLDGSAGKKDQPPQAAPEPHCPDCGKPMQQRPGGWWCRHCGYAGHNVFSREAMATTEARQSSPGPASVPPDELAVPSAEASPPDCPAHGVTAPTQPRRRALPESASNTPLADIPGFPAELVRRLAERGIHCAGDVIVQAVNLKAFAPESFSKGEPQTWSCFVFHARGLFTMDEAKEAAEAFAAWHHEQTAPPARQRRSAISAEQLAHPCPKCGAAAGQRCRNYKGQNKATCAERCPTKRTSQARPAPPAAPELPVAPVAQANLFGQPAAAGAAGPAVPEASSAGEAPLPDDQCLKMALMNALFPLPELAEEWERLRRTGATDSTLMMSVASLWGLQHQGGQGQLAYICEGGTSPRFWLGRRRQGTPALEGPALTAAVRECLGIGQPAPGKAHGWSPDGPVPRLTGEPIGPMGLTALKLDDAVATGKLETIDVPRIEAVALGGTLYAVTGQHNQLVAGEGVPAGTFDRTWCLRPLYDPSRYEAMGHAWPICRTVDGQVAGQERFTGRVVKVGRKELVIGSAGEARQLLQRAEV